MKYTIHTEVGSPAYLQLYKQVREDIVQGIYPHNTKLPSKRTIADEVGVSTVTVEHAYALLADEGYIEPRERSGYFVIFQVSDGFAGAAGLGVETWVDDLMIGLEVREIFAQRQKDLKKSSAANTLIQLQLSWKF